MHVKGFCFYEVQLTRIDGPRSGGTNSHDALISLIMGFIEETYGIKRAKKIAKIEGMAIS